MEALLGQLFRLSDLENDSSVEEGEEDEGQDRRQGRADPVDVVILVVRVQSQLRRLDRSRVRVGPGCKREVQSLKKNLWCFCLGS